jgi:septum formation protein
VRLVLASASPRRRDLLSAAGYEFEVLPVEVDEHPRPGEAPARYVGRLAESKARAGAALRADAIVLGADTTVTIDGLILAKPEDEADARRMLRLLSGRVHDVLTGVSLVGPGLALVEVAHTHVWFDTLSEGDIEAYVASGEPFGKAGAYAIQGRAARFVTRIEGDYPNVVGLPVALVHRRLRELVDARK